LDNNKGIIFSNVEAHNVFILFFGQLVSVTSAMD